MTIFTSILSAFGGAAIALAVATYFARRFMDIQIAKRIEKYKSELEQKTSILKTELSIYAHEQNVGLTRIDQQRSQAIQEIYGTIVGWYDIFIEISKPNGPDHLSTDDKLTYYNDLTNFLIDAANRISIQSQNTAIYFSNESYEKIAKFGIAAMDKSYAFKNSTFGKLDMSNDSYKIPLLSIIECERVKLPEVIGTELNKLKNDLIIEFRRLLKAGPEAQLPSKTQNENISK